MDKFARYGKAIAAGSAILLSVLGASPAAHASPFIETFDGTLDITQNTVFGSFPGHTNVTLEFAAQDLTNPGNFFDGNAFVGNLPCVHAGCSALVPFEFTGTFGGVDGDQWSMDLQAVSGLDSKSSGFPSTIVDHGNFNFTIPGTGPVTEVPLGNTFSFTAGDPLAANGGINSLAPAVATPEPDPVSTAVPLALFVSALLKLSDGRRRRQDDNHPS